MTTTSRAVCGNRISMNGMYHARRDLIAKRNAETDPIKRGQINVLIEQLTNYDRATGMQRMALASAIKAQLNRMAPIQG